MVSRAKMCRIVVLWPAKGFEGRIFYNRLKSSHFGCLLILCAVMGMLVGQMWPTKYLCKESLDNSRYITNTQQIKGVNNLKKCVTFFYGITTNLLVVSLNSRNLGILMRKETRTAKPR